MKPPRFGTVFARTIYRRIPFESFSFLGKNGWHDQLSSTTVIYEQKEGQVKFMQGIWIFLLIGAYITVIGNSSIEKFISEGRKIDMLETAKQYEIKSNIENLVTSK